MSTVFSEQPAIRPHRGHGPGGAARAAAGGGALHRAAGRQRGRVPRAAAGAGRADRGVDRGRPGQRREFAARAEQARRDGGVGGARGPHPAAQSRGRRHLRGLRQGARARRDRGVDRRRHGDLRRRAHPEPAAAAGRRGAGQGHRPDRADPGHLRPARAQPRGQGPGGAGPAAVPAAQAPRLGRVAVPAGGRPGGRRRRDRHPRPGRDQAGDRPAAAADAHLPAEAGYLGFLDRPQGAA